MRKKPFESTVGKRKSADHQHPFPTIYSTYAKTNFCPAVASILLSVNAFHLEQSKILLYG